MARALRFVRCERGSNAVEFALVAPVLLLLLVGTTLIGLYLGISHSVAQVAAGGARSAIGGLDANERSAMTRAYVERVAGQYTLVDLERLSLSTSESGQFYQVNLSYDIGDSFTVFGLDKLLGTTIEQSATAELPS